MRWLLLLSARGLAVLGALLSLCFFAVFATFLLPALGRPDLVDGGGGLLSVGLAVGAFGLPAAWMLVLAGAGALGAIVAPRRGWLALTVLIAPSLATPLFAAAGAGALHLWHPTDVAPVVGVGVATLAPGVVLLVAGVAAFVHARLKAATPRRRLVRHDTPTVQP